MNEWNLITTAPKDETEIIVFWYEGTWPCMSIAHWDNIQSGWYDGEWDIYPTHWMPLPEPPPSPDGLSGPDVAEYVSDNNANL